MPQGESSHDHQASNAHGDAYFDWRHYVIYLGCLVGGTILLIWVWAMSISNHNAVIMSDQAFILPLTVAMPSHNPDEAVPEDAHASEGEHGDTLQTDEHAEESDAPLAKIVVEDVVAGLQEETPFGPLPVRGKDGKTAFDAYQAPPAGDAETPSVTAPRVAIVLRNFGLSQKLSTEAIKSLPHGVTFALSPYAGGDVLAMVRSAREAGHEVWLDVPLPDAGSDTTDTGPVTLSELNDDNTNRKRLLTAMGVAPGYAGLIVAEASPFMKDPMFKTVVVETAQERGVALAVDGTGLAAPIPGIYSTLLVTDADSLQSAFNGAYGKSDGIALSMDLSRLSINAIKALGASIAKDHKGRITPLSRIVPAPLPLEEDGPAAASAPASSSAPAAATESAAPPPPAEPPAAAAAHH
jgi:polysaccharide deacetylase 2 family uncharacterized protein YibQ